MGNKRSRDLTKPKERGRPCSCDTFDVSVRCVDSSVLAVSLSTDLPVNTKVAVRALRKFREIDGHAWYWTCLDEAFPVTPQANGWNGFVLHWTNDDLDTKGLHMYRHLKGEMHLSDGMAAEPSSDLEVSVKAPTTLHRFGLCNRLLTGKAVLLRPRGHSLQRTAVVAVPTSRIVLKQLGF